MVQEVSACGAKIKQQVVNDMIGDERAKFLFKEMRMTFDQKSCSTICILGNHVPAGEREKTCSLASV